MLRCLTLAVLRAVATANHQMETSHTDRETANCEHLRCRKGIVQSIAYIDHMKAHVSTSTSRNSLKKFIIKFRNCFLHGSDPPRCWILTWSITASYPYNYSWQKQRNHSISRLLSCKEKKARGNDNSRGFSKIEPFRQNKTDYTKTLEKNMHMFEFMYMYNKIRGKSAFIRIIAQFTIFLGSDCTKNVYRRYITEKNQRTFPRITLIIQNSPHYFPRAKLRARIFCKTWNQAGINTKFAR